MRCQRNFLKLIPFAFVCVLVWCILFQEGLLTNRTEVHQEIVYQFSALEQKQLDNGIEDLRSSNAIDKHILEELLYKRKSKKSSRSSSKDKTRSWFNRKNPPPSKLPVSDHPLFPGFIIENPDICGDSPVDILIYIHCSVDHFGRRRVIRETWASTKLFHDISIRTVFILGKPATDSEQTEVLNEFAAHGDIVQGDFMDTFRNLTMKAITNLIWTNWHCPQAKYILKADDDYFVDTFSVIEDFLPQLATMKTSLKCRYSENFEIIRKQSIKWHIEPEILKARTHWPPFCSGFFVIYTGDLIPALYEKSFNITEYISVDDAYLFGLLTEGNSNVTFLNIRDKLSLNTRPKPVEEISGNVKFEFSVFEIELPETARSLWDLRLKRLSDWGREHSMYVKLFETGSDHKTVIIK